MRLILLVAALFCALPASAILTRADRDDAEYVELATRYPAAIEIGPGLEGVLIAPRWVLTSAHGAMLLQGAKARPPLTLGGRPNQVAHAFVHPDWKQGTAADLALVLLRDPVDNIVPAPISGEPHEIDEIAFVVGHGETGKLGETARRTDGKKRAAINTIDRVLPTTLGLRIKPADSASDLQGGPAPGERGAPLFIESNGQAYVAGIYSANEGDWQVFARVSIFTQWISDTMFRAGVEEAKRPGDPPAPGPHDGGRPSPGKATRSTS